MLFARKPSVTLPNQEVSLEQARSTLKKVILDHQLLGIDIVLLYLRKLAENMKSLLDTDWMSFRSIIGYANESIGPLNLVSVVDRNTEVPMLTGSATEKDDNWMLILLAAFYRLHTVQNEGHRKSLFRTLGIKLREAGLSNTRLLEQVFKVTLSLWCDSEFVKMVAIFDMYFVRFPNHQLSGARIGTGESRYKECTALKSLLDFAEQIGKSNTEIAEWIWWPILKKEFEVITKPGQEIDYHYSYTPYLKDLRLVQRSPYSSAFNPNMHMFIHAIGSTLGIQRSVNAKVNKKWDIFNGTLENAAIFAYALILVKEKKADIMNPLEWQHSLQKGGKRTNEALIKVYNIWAEMSQTQPGTVGEDLRSRAISRLKVAGLIID